MPNATETNPTPTTDPARSPLAAISRLFRSSKFLVMVAGFIVATLAKYGYDVDNELIMTGLGLVGLLIASIAHEDAAKKKATPVVPLIGESIAATGAMLDLTEDATEAARQTIRAAGGAWSALFAERILAELDAQKATRAIRPVDPTRMDGGAALAPGANAPR